MKIQPYTKIRRIKIWVKHSLKKEKGTTNTNSGMTFSGKM
jgi:hypothetical protein